MGGPRFQTNLRHWFPYQGGTSTSSLVARKPQGVKGPDLGLRTPGLQSWFCIWLALWHLSNLLTFLWPGFPSTKWGVGPMLRGAVYCNLYESLKFWNSVSQQLIAADTYHFIEHLYTNHYVSISYTSPHSTNSVKQKLLLVYRWGYRGRGRTVACPGATSGGTQGSLHHPCLTLKPVCWLTITLYTHSLRPELECTRCSESTGRVSEITEGSSYV